MTDHNIIVTHRLKGFVMQTYIDYLNKKRVDTTAKADKIAVIASVVFPKYVWLATGGKHDITAYIINTNKAVGLLVEIFGLQIVEDVETIPDSEFYFATHGRKMQTNEKWVQKHKLYS